MRKVIVKPKSSKSKNRLANIMDNNPVCIVEQDTGGDFFCHLQTDYVAYEEDVYYD